MTEERDDRIAWKRAYARARWRDGVVQGVQQSPDLTFLFRLSIEREARKRGLTDAETKELLND